MKGLEISIKYLSEVKNDNPTLRYDSEYFKKEYLEIFSKLYKNRCEKVSKLSSWVTQGPNPIFDENGGIPCLTGRNINKGTVNYNDPDFVNSSEYENLKRFQLKIGDTLITLKGKGSIGKIGYVTNERKAIFSRNIGVIRPKGIDSGYINAFILSNYGKKILERGETGGTGQSTLTTEYIKNIYVPRFSIEKEVSNLVKLSEKVLLKSQNTYQQAETLLLETVGLNNLQTSTDQVNIKNFKYSFGTTGRLDAEFYQPKFEELKALIERNKSGYNKLDCYIDNYSTGYPYKSESYTEHGIPLIRINNIQKGELDLSNAAKVPLSDVSLSPKDLAKENDILISMSGTIGNSCKVPKDVNALVNQRIMRITPKDYDFNVLPLVINSVIGRFQLEQIGTGGVQTNISSSDIKDIIIPVINKKQEHKIAELVDESFTLKKQSEQLLEKAKRAVEIAIEQNEKAAIDFINS